MPDWAEVWAPFIAEAQKMHQEKAWWALTDPVAYLWLRRAERRGAIVPWSPR